MSDYIWHPSPEHLTQSNIARFMHQQGLTSYDELIKKSQQDTDWFWRACLEDLQLEWFKKYEQVQGGELPFASWFLGGKINITHNCIDRHARGPNQDKLAFIWEGDCGAVKKVTYAELFRDVNQLAAGLKKLGVVMGDAVGIYMPMMPEMITAFFATLKLGAVAVPIFSGFGPEPTAIRLKDAQAKVLITADGGLRRGKKIPVKQQADLAAAQVSSIQKVIVAKRLHEPIDWVQGRDLWWDDCLKLSHDPVPTEPTASEDCALIIYTSGTTGKPKGTVHTHAGCLAQMTKEVAYVMDCKPDDRFFWVTDIGWMMGPWEMIGVTALGATFVIFEGAPNYPGPDRLWEMVAKHHVSILGVSPTAVRLLKKEGLAPVQKHNLSTLRILGSTGEPWDPESYRWLFEHIGGKRCPIMNISGGTEIVGCHLAPLPIQPLKPMSLGGPGLGMAVDVFNEDGKSVREEVGYLVCKKAAPSMTKGFLHDQQRYLDTYFAKWPKIWNHGDWAYVDQDGQWFLRGRADDVIKVAGHRTGPAEIESALMQHEAVVEAAAIGVPHDIKGESVVCFVVLKRPADDPQQLTQELTEEVTAKLGKTLVPETIVFVPNLPKTRSAKIVRGVIKKKFLGQSPIDTSSIENPDALEAIPPQQKLTIL